MLNVKITSEYPLTSLCRFSQAVTIKVETIQTQKLSPGHTNDTTFPFAGMWWGIQGHGPGLIPGSWIMMRHL